MLIQHRTKNQLSVLLIALMATVAAACAKKDVVRLPGERIPVLSLETDLAADAGLENVPVTLPRPWTNQNWSQAGGNSESLMHHLDLNDNLNKVWTIQIGRGSVYYERMTMPPIVHNGVVYTLDTQGRVAAISAGSGTLLWRRQVINPNEPSDVAYGGGLAFGDGRIYLTSGYGFMAALDANNGQEIWRYDVGIPMRSKPSFGNGRVYAMTDDNQLLALDATDGSFLWDYVGIVENAGVLGSAAPTLYNDTLIVGFSSGELIAFRSENGQVLWQDSLGLTSSISAISTLNDIDGNPVVHDGRVYAISHSGRMVSIDLRTGERVWEKNVGSLYTPWVAGNYIFVLSTDNELAAMTARDGRIKWVTQLQRFEDPEDRSGVIRWSGPVLGGDRLVAVSSHGYAVSISPYTGEILSALELEEDTVLPPVIANKTLYLLNEDGELSAWR